jgi:YafQ family addiction module toxin component
MYSLDIKLLLRKKLRKVFKRDKRRHEIIFRKVAEIVQNPHHYKNLRTPLQHWKRVHIDSSFVLTFSVDEKSKTVTLEDYDHHDNIYNN